MNKSHICAFAVAAALSLMVTGCATHPHAIDYAGQRTDVVFATNIQPLKAQDITRATSPEELVAHALALGAEGRWLDAGDLFSELADIRSHDGSWESRCHAAASLCYMHAGRLDACSTAADKTGVSDGWSRYGEPDEIRIIRELGDLVGRPLTGAQLDSELDEIVGNRN